MLNEGISTLEWSDRMKNFTISITVLGVLLAAMWPAYARDTKHSADRRRHGNQGRRRKLEGSVKFFGRKQEYPKVVTKRH